MIYIQIYTNTYKYVKIQICTYIHKMVQKYIHTVFNKVTFHPDPPRNFTLVATNSSSAVFSFQDQIRPMNLVNFTLRCVSAEHSTNMTLSLEDLQVSGTITVSDLQPFTEYRCSVGKSHAYGHAQPSHHLDIFTGVKSGECNSPVKACTRVTFYVWYCSTVHDLTSITPDIVTYLKLRYYS